MSIQTYNQQTLTAALSAMATTQQQIISQEIILPGIVEADGLLVQERTLPLLTAHQVVVEVEATGISFAEQAMRRGRYPGQPKFPFVPGYDLVGRVSQVGPQVDRALIGQRVAALTKVGDGPAMSFYPLPTYCRYPRPSMRHKQKP